VKSKLVAAILLTTTLLPTSSLHAGAMTKAMREAMQYVGRKFSREVAEEGIRVLTIYPTATETPMMATSGMNPVGGRDTPEAVARESIEAIIDGRLEVIRGGADRIEMVKLNRNDPIAIDDVLRPMRASMEEASRDHSAL